MKSRKLEQKQIWTEDPAISYKNFLEFVNETTKQDVQFNKETLKVLSTLFSSKKEEKEDSNNVKVSSKDGSFYPLSTALSSPLYCSKLIIRNIVNLDFSFVFNSTIIPRIVGMDADSKLGKNLSIAYRNIVPAEFSEVTQLAGPMGYHEYIIEGDGFNAEDSYASFCINSDFDKTRVKIVIENCKGNIVINGLNEDQMAKIFENKCSKEDLSFTILPAFTFKMGSSS